MSQLKKSSDYSIAMSHFIVTILMLAIFNIVTEKIINSFILYLLKSVIMAFAIASVFFILKYFIIYFTIKYSAEYIHETYVINPKNKIVDISTMYLAITLGTLSIISLFLAFGIENIFIVFETIVFLVFFYIVSKKFIENTRK